LSWLKSALLFGPTLVGPDGVENTCLLIKSISSSNNPFKVSPRANGSLCPVDGDSPSEVVFNLISPLPVFTQTFEEFLSVVIVTSSPKSKLAPPIKLSIVKSPSYTNE